jgi:beta-N-acetylhexosaminidase
MPMVTIERYDTERDEEAIYALWRAALGREWPLAQAAFAKLLTGSPLYQAGDHLVARQGQEVVGFVATNLDRGDPTSAAIPVLCVEPRLQRRGIGTALHQAALAHLRASGATRVQIGGGYSCVWPGVPDNLPAAKPFFESCGWSFLESCWDLAQPMRDYHSPADLITEIELSTATPADVPGLLDFEAREFLHWLGAFRGVAEVGDLDDLLIARDPHTHEIVGSLILYTQRSHPSRVDGFWDQLLGDPLGEIACVGVAEALNNRGIGTALVARASELLQQRGVAAVHIGWVYRVSFYGRLGYAPWRAFHMSWRELY